MSKEDLQGLKAAYNAVFDEDGNVKNCGRELTRILIKEVAKHTTVNVGDESTGIMKVDKLKTVYQELTAFQGALVL
jgi:hypothetical protein